MKKGSRCALGLTLFVFATLCGAFAQEVIGGWEGGPGNGYSFATSVFSIPGSATNSFVVRPSASFLYYNYLDSTGTTDVTAPGVALTLGYRLRTPRLTLTLGPGVSTRWEHRAFADGTVLDRTIVGATAQAEAFFQANRLTNLNLIGSYEQGNRYAWVRGGLKRQVTNRDFKNSTALLIGPEITGQGNQDVRQYQGGAVAEIAIFHAHASLQLRSGYARLQFSNGSIQTRPYFGVGFYRSFYTQHLPTADEANP